jgi:UDP-3-O-[3-hydroxymyristoyl] glucosamine N-acyltransferase
MTGRRNTILVGPKATLATGAIEIRGSDSVVVIGERVLLRDSRIATTSSARVALGANLSCVGGNILAEGTAGAILCGDDCMFARGISIRTDDGHGVFDRSSQRRINNTSPVIVHEHVWLGSGVRVNKGAIIESGVIVAQVSVASGRLKARSVYGGAPARVIREDVAWSRTGEWKDIPDRYR